MDSLELTVTLPSIVFFISLRTSERSLPCSLIKEDGNSFIIWVSSYRCFNGEPETINEQCRQGSEQGGKHPVMTGERMKCPDSTLGSRQFDCPVPAEQKGIGFIPMITRKEKL